METQTIEQKLKEKIVTYKTEVKAREPTISEKRLASYERLMENRKAVFESTDTENRVDLLSHNSDFCLIMNWSHERARTVKREDFVESIKSRLVDGGIANPEVIAKYRSYLIEDKNTPYSGQSLLERLSEKKNSLIKYLFPWKYS